MKKKKRIIIDIMIVLLIGVMIYSVYTIWDQSAIYRQEKAINHRLMTYKPSAVPDVTGTPEPTVSLNPSPTPQPSPRTNPSIDSAKKKNPDVVGWLTVPGTPIDYLFVQGPDNDYYLHRDINQNYLYAGTVFLDFRCARDFSSFNSLLYGHHMKDGSMFAGLRYFKTKSFFDSHQYGQIYLSDKTYQIEFFAFMIRPAADMKIYTYELADSASKTDFFNYIKSNAVNYRDIGLTPEDKLVTLYSCTYEFTDARMLLVGKLVEAY